MGSKLENIFRLLLKDETPEADSWNSPSSKVWNNIEQDLKEENRNRYSFFWMSFGFVVLVVFGLLLIRQCSRMDRPTNRQLISSVTFLPKEKITTNSPGELKLNNKGIANDDLAEAFTPPIHSNKNQSSGPPTIASSTAVQDQSPLKGSIYPLIAEQQAIKDEPADFKSRDESNVGKLVNDAYAAGNSSRLLPVRPIQPLRAADLFAELAGSPLSEGSGHILFPVRQKSSWVIITDFTIALGTVNTDFSNPLNKDLFDNRQTFAYETGLRLEYYPRNNFWGLGIGLQYRHLQLLSDYGMRLNYTSHNEHQNPDGHYDNIYQRDMPSLFGEMSADLALLRLNNSMLDEGTPFDLDLTMEHRLEFLNVPFYTIIRTSGGPFRFYARGGLSVNYMVSPPSSFVNALESNHEAIHHRHSTLNASDNNGHGLRRWQLGMFWGVGVEYWISPSWSFGVEPYYYGDITPIYRDKQVDSKSTLFGSSISIRYQLK